MSNNKKLFLPGKFIGSILIALMVIFLVLTCVSFMVRAFYGLRYVFAILTMVMIPIAFIFAGRIAPKLNGKAMDKFVNELPEIRVPARVVEKSVGSASQTAMNHAGFVVVSIFNLTFEMPDNKRLYFRVTEDQYNTIMENDEGTLVYKDIGTQRWFIDFCR